MYMVHLGVERRIKILICVFLLGLLCAYSPQLIVLGGGIATAFPLFKEAMYETLKDFPYPRVVADVKIVSSQLQDAGLLGASALLG